MDTAALAWFPCRVSKDAGEEKALGMQREIRIHQAEKNGIVGDGGDTTHTILQPTAKGAQGSSDVTGDS